MAARGTRDGNRRTGGTEAGRVSARSSRGEAARHRRRVGQREDSGGTGAGCTGRGPLHRRGAGAARRHAQRPHPRLGESALHRSAARRWHVPLGRCGARTAGAGRRRWLAPGGDKLRLGRYGMHPDVGFAPRRAAGGCSLRRFLDRMGRSLRHAGGDGGGMTDTPKRGFRTRLSHTGRAGKRVHGFVNPPLLRGSTVLTPTMAERRALQSRRGERVLAYGLGGSETHWALEDVIAEVEGGTRCAIVCSGLAAVTTPLLAFLKSGDHCLMPDSVYGPSRNFANGVLKRYGVETTFYDPVVDEAGIADLMRPNTTVVYTESPGSHTFEVQDIPAIARAAHARGAKVLMDNTWGIHHFQPFKHGVDVSIQAATKYPAGHSDILIGTVTVNSVEDWHALHATVRGLGQYASPDDCWLTLRGMRTMGVRLAQQMDSGIEVAHWLSRRPEVKQVLHPALPGAPGHAIWRRDFTGACSLFGAVFRPDYSVHAVHRMIDGLELFGIGASWGGFESLILPTTGTIRRTAGSGTFEGPAVRLHIGLEDTDDLIADLEQGLAVLRSVGRTEGEYDVGDPDA